MRLEPGAEENEIFRARLQTAGLTREDIEKK
jgi:hypothetical protein